METLKLKIKSNLKILALTLISVILITAASFMSPFFLSISNIRNLLVHASVLAIMAIPMTFTLISGGLDLSIGSNIAFAGVIGFLVYQFTGNPLIGMIGCIAAGGFIGILNGIMIGYLKINAFMVTLAFLAIVRGATLTITGGRTISVVNKTFNYLGQGSIFGIPVILILIVVIYIISHYVLRHSILGRSIYAIGGNENAAIAAGIKTKLIILYIYILSGMMAGLCSIFVVGRLSSIQPWAGLGVEFETIVAVILGGISIAGGEGNLMESLIGVIILAIILNILGLLPISPFYQYVAKGAIMIGAVFIYGRLKRMQE